MKRLLILALALLAPSLACAQAIVTADCDAIAPFGSAGSQHFPFMSVSGKLCVYGSSAGAGTTGPVNGVVDSFVDGWSQTHGSTTDAAWSGSGAGTLVAIEKKISAQMAGAIPAQATDGVVIGGAQPVASTLGGATPYNLIAASGTNSTLISAGVHTVYGVQLANIGAAPAYLKLYDKATAPTCGTDTPKAVFIIPAAATAANGGGSNVAIPVGKAFALGLGICTVTGIDNTNSTGVAASNVAINIDYK